MTFYCNGCSGFMWPWQDRVRRYSDSYHMDDGSIIRTEKEYHPACWEEYETRQAMALMSELVEPPGTIIEVPKGFAMRGGFKWG